MTTNKRPDDAWEDGDVQLPEPKLENKAAHTPFNPDPLFSGTFSEQRDQKEKS